MKSKKQKVLIFAADLYEDLELQYPKYRLREADKEVVIAGEKGNIVYKGVHGYPCKSDVSFADIDVKDFSALVIPGGYGPDTLRRNPKVLEITQQFNAQKKLIAFICHAGWVPISAKVIKGIKCTSYVAIKDDMINAGAKWTDAPVVIDKHFISSRFQDDLPHFCVAIVEYLANKN